MTKQTFPRGAIYCPERYAQLLDYSGMAFERKITPMDFDFVLDFGGKELIIGEFKTKNKTLPYGQRRAITTVLLAAHRSGVKVLGFVARHDCPPDEMIPAHDCRVFEFFCPFQSMQWQQPQGDRRVKEFIDSWRVWHRAQSSQK